MLPLHRERCTSPTVRYVPLVCSEHISAYECARLLEYVSVHAHWGAAGAYVSECTLCRICAQLTPPSPSAEGARYRVPHLTRHDPQIPPALTLAPFEEL